MSNEIDYSNLPELPKKLGEKLTEIRERSRLSPDEFAPHVKAEDGEAIESYESVEGDMPVSVLWAYVKLSGLPMENLMDDDRDLCSGHRHQGKRRLAGVAANASRKRAGLLPLVQPRSADLDP